MAPTTPRLLRLSHSLCVGILLSHSLTAYNNPSSRVRFLHAKPKPKPKPNPLCFPFSLSVFLSISSLYYFHHTKPFAPPKFPVRFSNRFSPTPLQQHNFVFVFFEIKFLGCFLRQNLAFRHRYVAISLLSFFRFPFLVCLPLMSSRWDFVNLLIDCNIGITAGLVHYSSGLGLGLH